MTTTIPVHRNRRYWLRLMRLALAVIFITVSVVTLGLGAAPMWWLLHPTCARTGTPADQGFTYQDVSIPNQEGGAWKGYFIPAQAGATDRGGAVIIAPPAYNGDAGSTLYETKLLVRAGFPVLMFESVVCTRGGVHSLGPLEAAQITDALSFLEQNKAQFKIDMSKVALHGFSSAGAASIFAAAGDPKIAAVLAEGNYFNLDAYMSIGQSSSVFEKVMLFAMRLTYRISTGQDPDVLTPIRAIPKIPPRPLFLIYGSLEAKRGGADQLLAAAKASDPTNPRFPKLWIVEGVEHGGYVYAAGGEDDYARNAVSFYACALTADCSAWDGLWEARQ